MGVLSIRPEAFRSEAAGFRVAKAPPWQHPGVKPVRRVLGFVAVPVPPINRLAPARRSQFIYGLSGSRGVIQVANRELAVSECTCETKDEPKGNWGALTVGPSRLQHSALTP